MERFAERKYLRQKVKLDFSRVKGRPRLFCDEPAIVARFASELRQAAAGWWGNGTPVLMRGQVADHPGMVPGLFRTPNATLPIRILLAAEAAFGTELRKRVPLGRFKRANTAALLQHYGFRTSWLDVVDNLWIAVWFATHVLERSSSTRWSVVRRQKGTGWIHFLSPRASTASASALDFREAHHGLSLRPHTQHGWAIRGKGGASDLNEYVIASIEFPVTNRWSLGGHLWEAGFLFPPAKIDDTLSKLLKHDAGQIAKVVLARFSVPGATLGDVYEVD